MTNAGTAGPQHHGKSLRHNGLFSAAEVVLGGICLLIIYRHVADVLGIAMLGVWGLILSTTGFGRAADLGIAASLSRFVARSLGHGRGDLAKLYMRSGVGFMTVAMGAVTIAAWAPLHWGLAIALSGADLAAAREVLPWAMLSIWLLMIKTSLDSCLIGVHRADLRSIAGIVGMLLQVVLSLSLVGNFGLMGLAWSQAGQFLFAITLELVFLSTVASVGGGRTPLFDWALFKEMLGFGLGLQAGSIANLLFEPIAKGAIGATYGTYTLGLFESAYRATYQLKNIATAALQPSIPVLTQASQVSAHQRDAAYRRTLRAACLLASVLMIGAVAGAPLLSWLLLQSVNGTFVSISAVLALTWAFTIVAAPTYYLVVAIGRFWPYVTSECAAVAVVPLGVWGTSQLGPLWLVGVGVLLAKSVGALVLMTTRLPGAAGGVRAVVNPWVLGTLGAIATAAATAIAISSWY